MSTEYISRTRHLRDEEQSLFISYLKPHAAVTSSTIRRWLKTVMTFSGIDVSLFKAHIVRPASTSKAQCSFIPIGDILKGSGWSRECTFAKFYRKEIQKYDVSYADAVLS